MTVPSVTSDYVFDDYDYLGLDADLGDLLGRQVIKDDATKDDTEDVDFEDFSAELIN